MLQSNEKPLGEALLSARFHPSFLFTTRIYTSLRTREFLKEMSKPKPAD
jgi:hypothetical protein